VTARVDLLVVDNYDSFTHNAVDLLAQLGAHPIVVRNDQIDVAAVQQMAPRGIVLSPGPGRPRDAGICVPLIRALGPVVPILGICLGHQAISKAYGGRIVRAQEPLHGSPSEIHHQGAGLLRGLPRPFHAARYHSLVVDPRHAGRGLAVTCRSAAGEIMGLRHATHPVEGVQFHPESYLSPEGPSILAAFLRRIGLRPSPASRVVR
jgi:anthranilate synthase/aminodeoxychorismate synthase-like glutamine amidotransferase